MVKCMFMFEGPFWCQNNIALSIVLKRDWVYGMQNSGVTQINFLIRLHLGGGVRGHSSPFT